MNEQIDPVLDRVLHRLGSATPRPGLENRVLARLAEAPMQTRVWHLPRLALGMTAAAIACVGIVAGSVNHSHRILPVAPGLQIPGQSAAGVGAASAAHVAAEPVTPLPQERPRSVRETLNGRAVILQHGKKPAGMAVPRTPATQE